MSTPSDVLHRALCARPLQTASELTLSVADAGHGPMTTAEIERLLAGDPRLRPDTSTPPRWRALGTGQPGTSLRLPTPRRQVPQVVAPAAAFGERAVPVPAFAPQPVASGGILPAAAFAGRPSVRLQETVPAAATPVRVPVFARLAEVPKPPAEPSVARTPVAGPTSTSAPARTPALADERPSARSGASTPTPDVAGHVAPTHTSAVASSAPPTSMPAVAPPAAPAYGPTAASVYTPLVAPTTAAHATPAVAPTVAPAPTAPVELARARTDEPASARTAATTEAPAVVPISARTAASAEAPTVTPTSAGTAAPTVTGTTVTPAEAHPVAPVTAPTTPALTVTAEVAERLPTRSAPDAESVVTAPATPPSGLFQALAAPLVVERVPSLPGGEVRYVGPQLRRWQKDVLDAWLAEERRGIVEAVIAEGRGVVGVLAAWDALTRGEKVLVLVPTSNLLDEWFSTLELYLPGLSIGRRDLTTAHTFDECDVLVSLVSAAFGHELLPEGRAGLLIADEVHKYGSARPAATLRDGFDARLGLTSSMERLDPGFDEVLRPYFGAVLDGCDLRRGRKDGVIAPFRLAFLPVDLTAAEQVEHDALSAQIAELTQRLTEHGCAASRFAEDVIRLQGSWQDNARGAADASAYLRAVSTRRDLLATSSAKVDALATLAPTLGRSPHALVFTHTKHGADAAAKTLRAAGVPAAWWHNGLEPEGRRSILSDLHGDRLSVLTAAKVLDEGLGLPTVDAVVVLAASRSYRQLVQRVSAVLPPTEADRLPVVVVVQARGTVDVEDGLVADLAAVATEVRTFDAGTSGAAVAAWFLGV